MTDSLDDRKLIMYRVVRTYEWTCPECGHINTSKSRPISDLVCMKCSKSVISWGEQD